MVLAEAGVSRRHARIRSLAGRFFAEDLGSQNGTKVNGEPILTPCEIRAGDSLEVGPVVISFALLDEIYTEPGLPQPASLLVPAAPRDALDLEPTHTGRPPPEPESIEAVVSGGRLDALDFVPTASVPIIRHTPGESVYLPRTRSEEAPTLADPHSWSTDPGDDSSEPTLPPDTDSLVPRGPPRARACRSPLSMRSALVVSVALGLAAAALAFLLASRSPATPGAPMGADPPAAGEASP